MTSDRSELFSVAAVGVLAVAVGIGMNYVRDAGSSVSSSASASDTAGRKAAVAVAHDFGLVRAESTRTHEFTVRNDTGATWTVAAVEARCNCTVPNASDEEIGPGETFRATVSYRAGAKNADDRKTVSVSFREPAAPKVLLTVAARVRKPLSMPDTLVLPGAARGKAVDGHFVVANYGDEPWQEIDVTSSADWLKASVVPLESKAERPAEAVQAWRVLVRAETRDMGYGRQTAEVAVRTTRGESRRSAMLTVKLDVQTPVAAIPGEIFLPGVARGEPRSTTVLLRFAEANAPASVEAVELAHDLGDQLRLRWAEPSGRFWKLEATLTPGPSSESYLTGAVRLAFRGGELPDLEIPIRASVAAPPAVTP